MRDVNVVVLFLGKEIATANKETDKNSGNSADETYNNWCEKITRGSQQIWDSRKNLVN